MPAKPCPTADWLFSLCIDQLRYLAEAEQGGGRSLHKPCCYIALANPLIIKVGIATNPPGDAKKNSKLGPRKRP